MYCVCVYGSLCIYIYIEREREGERDVYIYIYIYTHISMCCRRAVHVVPIRKGG